ncbi:MAG: hypothetical protein ABIA75_04230 [Candidatus Neomarinimicrobiota bacterium]
MTPKIKEPILLERDPIVAFRYEYATVSILVPYRIEGREPESIRLYLALRSRPEMILLEHEFSVGDTLELSLPRNVLSQDEMGNLAVIQPSGGDYETIKILFSAGTVPEISLPAVLIREKPYVITGVVLERNTMLPVAGAVVELMARSLNTIYGTTVSNSSGFFRIELKNEYGHSVDFSLRILSDQKYPERQVTVEFDTTKQFTTQVLLGVSDSGLSSGVRYRVLENGTAFRAGPENSADIKFFLAAGDLVIVTRVAGNRLFGFVEMEAGGGDKIQAVHGWIRGKDVELSN